MKRLILIAIFVFVALSVTAQRPHPNDNGKREIFNKDFIERFVSDLSDKQKNDLESLAVEFNKKASVFRDNLKTKNTELRKLVDDLSVSQDVINVKVDEVSKVRGELEKLKIEFKRRADMILSPQQRSTMKAGMECFKNDKMR